VTVRTAEEGDEQRIVELYAELMEHIGRLDEIYRSPGVMEDKVTEWFRKAGPDDTWKVVVAEADGVVVGFFANEVGDAEAYVEAERAGEIKIACVDEEYRDQSIGRKLFERSLAWFRDHDVDHVKVVSDVRNAEYRKCECNSDQKVSRCLFQYQ